MQSPCMGCKRTGCGTYHDECEMYQKFKIERMDIASKKAYKPCRRDYKKFLPKLSPTSPMKQNKAY